MNISSSSWLFLSLFLLLFGCGGSSSNSNNDTPNSNPDPLINNPVDPDPTIGTPNNPTSANPAEGLIADDLALRPMQAIAKPGYLQTITDPSFGTTIRRITDADAGNVIKPMYSTIQAWNADESMMILYDQGNGVHRLLHGHTYAFIRNLDDIRPDDIEQIFWDFDDPNVFYFVDRSTSELVRYTVSSRNRQVLANFANESGCENVSLGNDVQMNSYDSDVFSFRCGNDIAYSYRISTATLTTFNLADVNYVAPMPAPSGNLYFHRTDVYDANGVLLRELNKNKPEHESLGKLGNGNDALFSVEFSAGPQGGCDGNIIAHDLTTGECFDVISQRKGYDYSKSGTHVSALAHRNPGWIAASMVGFEEDGQALLDQELVIANVQDKDNVKVYRIGHHRADENEFDYWGEPHAVISPTGTRVLFGSDWSGSADGQSVDSYVVELPSYQSPL